LRPHRLNHYLTTTTAVWPGGGCSLWLAFLDRVTAGDKELQSFLQKIAGYALTGSVREHALFFLYGLGGNGKGVFLNTLTAILGDYAKVSSAETFTATTGERHPADLAMLRGARLVTVQETEEGRPWAEVRIKSLTGGDPITARHMRQDFFTFEPQFKLLIAGNHKPTLRTVDDAIRRRMHLIPFKVSIPAAERDVTLQGRLTAEWGGILRWALEGCSRWQAEGLTPPAIVREATDEYLATEDSLSTWLAERIEKKGMTWSASSDLYTDWKLWAIRSNEQAGTQRRFAQNLVDRGIVAARRRDGARGFANVILKIEAESSANVFE
jgi:putative DNA primase/helicase